ncbi:MAG TPA: WecB/TagA/CpsF family glycosyltransferase [Streptosporangiaceae bacterium]|jgi:exopolysaccharide biosynthesis WecB/TagA/CpsF family protein
MVTVDVLDRGAALNMFDEALAGRVPPTAVASANLDHIHHFAGTATVLPTGVRDTIQWLTLLDGRPVVNAVGRQAAGAPVAALPGCELIGPVLDLAGARGARVALVGGGSATRAYWHDVLPERRPGLVMAGVWPVRWAELDQPGGGAALARDVASAEPDVLVVSLGKPRQELWLRDHMAGTGAKLALAFGSAVDYVAGTTRRPPGWAVGIGAEWLVRLAREPRRLGRRYLVNGPPALLKIRRDLVVVTPDRNLDPYGSR